MKEYKRLTNKDWKENYDIFEDVCCDTCAEDCGECERNFNALVRLGELEDKIENGELISPYDIGDNEIAFFVKHNADVREDFAKEFAQKIKDGVADYLYKTNFDGRKENVVDMFELCEIVDNTVKEYENEQEK